MAKPLNNLLCKRTTFVWSEECQSCFEQLKEALCKPPILQHPDPAKPNMLLCDASNYAFAGIHTQAQDHSYHVHIRFFFTSATMLVCN